MSNRRRGQGSGQRSGQGRGYHQGHHHVHHQGQGNATFDNDVEALNAQIQDLRLSSSMRSTSSRGHRRPPSSQRGAHVGHQHTDRNDDSRRVSAAGQQFRCLSCNQFAFQASHLFVFARTHHAVLDPELFKRVRGRPHPEPGNYIGGSRTWSIVDKFCCICCGRDWGITSRSADVVIPLVKVESFNIIDQNGNSKFYNKWGKVPINFKHSSRNRESTYMTEVRDLQFTSTFDINERITSDGAVVAISGLELTVPADAVPTGTQYDLLGDSVVFCSTLDEFTNTGDVLIAPSIQFEPSEKISQFQKNVLLKIKHIALNKNEVTVFKSDHKNADDLDEIEKNEERDDVDLDEAEHFTIDEDYIYIHTKSLRLFCFVESNRRISFSDDVTISVHSRVQSCLVELRVFAYDNAILHERHLQRFKNSLRMSGYHLEANRQVTLTGPLCEEDTLDVEATPRHRTLCDSTEEFMEHQRVFRKLFCVDSTKVAGETIVFPQEFASFVLNSNSQDCRFTKPLEANLRIKHKSSNAGLTTEVDSFDVQIDLE